MESALSTGFRKKNAWGAVQETGMDREGMAKHAKMLDWVMSRKPPSKTAVAIQKLAEQYRVAYVPTGTDVLAGHMTRLAGDNVKLDRVEQMLIALQRAGHLSREEAVRLQAAYLNERK